MNAKILIAGAAIAALAAGGASAATHHKKMHHKMHKSDDMAASSKYAAPDQPIPYAQLDSYMDSHGMKGDDMGAMKSSRHMKMSKKSMKHHGKMHHMAKGSSSDTGMAAPDNGAMSNPPATPPATPDTPSTPQ